MAYDAYSTAQLLGAFGVIDKPRPFIYDVFFKSEIKFNSEYVFFDQAARSRRLAPLVSPGLPGKPEALRSYSTTSLQPAYIKAKHALEPGKLLKRRVGEQISGDENPAQRHQLLVADTLQIQLDQISRREEVMAVQLMLTGSVTMVDENFAATTVNFNRPAQNTIALTGSSTWSTNGVDALLDLQLWSAQVQANSGFAPRIVVMDPKAFNLFMRSPGVALVMNSFRQTSGDVNLAGYAVGGLGNEAQMMGTIGGFEIWVYQNFYWDQNGNQVSMMPDNTVIMGDPVGCGGTRLYGAIQDMGALVAMDRYPKMWLQEDPSVEMIMTQSAPLPALGWSQATLAATVA
jgi:hypothetical protein